MQNRVAFIFAITPPYDAYQEMIKKRSTLGEAWESILRFDTNEKL